MAILDGVFRDGLTEKVPVESRPEGSEWVGHVIIGDTTRQKT